MTAIRKALHEPKIPLNISRVTRVEGQIALRVESAGDRSIKAAHGRLFAALADEELESQVSRGENGGRVLRHVSVGRVLKSASTIDLHEPAATEIAIPLLYGWGANGLRVVVFIQDPLSGHVLGVGEQKIKS